MGSQIEQYIKLITDMDHMIEIKVSSVGVCVSIAKLTSRKKTLADALEDIYIQLNCNCQDGSCSCFD